jgi:DUF971 family protein
MRDPTSWPDGQPPRPRTIRNDREGRQLVIEWADGRQDTISWERLRWACPCAVCAGEMGIPGRLARVSSLSPAEMTLEQIRGVGNYAIAARWQDGHDTGIYPFTLLYQLARG